LGASGKLDIFARLGDKEEQRERLATFRLLSFRTLRLCLRCLTSQKLLKFKV
jgi:hypothetical protein